MDIVFTAHNIRLDNGILTKPELSVTMDEYPWFISARRILTNLFPKDRRRIHLVDLGCLEGGFSVEFARMGFRVLGIDVRESNIEACRYVKSNTYLPNLQFIRDDVWNLAEYGKFDVAFCSGLLYHLDRPKQFLELLSKSISKIVILQTHFSTQYRNDTHGLSELTENESLEGRWYTEFSSEEDFIDRENQRWSSWENRRSFWIRREHLLQAIYDVGFDIVLEQFDSLGNKIAASMTEGYHKTHERGTFIGIKSESAPRSTFVGVNRLLSFGSRLITALRKRLSTSRISK